MLFRTGLYVKDHSVEKVQVASTPIASYNGNVTGLYIPEIVAMINAIQASGTPAPDNVLPIYGRNGVIVNRCGKNFLSRERDTTQYYVDSSGTLVSSSTWSASDYIPIKGNVTYTLTTNSVSGANPRHCFFDENGSLISSIVTANNVVTFTTPSNAAFARFSYRTESTNVQLEQGLTSTSYEAYNGNPYMQYFEGLLNGTYGFVDMGTLEWIYQSPQTRFYVAFSNAKAPSSNAYKANMVCPKYDTTAYSDFIGDNKMITLTNSGSLFVRDSSYTDATTFKAAMSGVYLIYEKATASTPTITQAQMDALTAAFDVDDKSAIIVFGQEVYGGYVNVNDGLLVITHANIASYNGESINEPWLSSMDEYSSGATPTTGAQVVYPLTTPTTVQLTPTQIEQLLSVNNVWADTGNVAVKFYNVIR